MKSWEQFEIECTSYLNQKFGEYATFTRDGGSDSTVPDVEVVTKNGSRFYIDAKQCPAQCGQFVLIPDVSSQSFVFSEKNATSPNKYTDAIVRHMNSDFEAFKEAGTSGKEIVIPNGPDIFAGWITLTYKNKGAFFFITNNFTIIPIDDFSKRFSVTAKYRIKRSGSTHVGESNAKAAVSFIREKGYPITGFEQEGDKLFVVSHSQLHNERFVLSGYEYMFSQRDNRYELRKLSNTFNANVIFSINVENHICGLKDDQFIHALQTI